MSGSTGEAAFTLSYALSPITLVNGIAANMSNGMMPIISITDDVSPITGTVGSGGSLDQEDYFAYYQPLPGGTLGENDIPTYPLANQSVAGNAIIFQGLVISLLMICPTRIGYTASQAKMTALQSALQNHDASGGTYIISTPKFVYPPAVRRRMVDVSTAESKQAQNTYQIDFYAPLLTLAQAQQAQNSLMSKLSNGSQLTGQPAWSGSQATVGSSSAAPATPTVNTSLPGTEQI
jgi:hypothetical protein